MRSFTTSLGLAVTLVAALCVFTPFSNVKAASGQIQVTIRDEARSPIEDATIEVSCDGSTFATLGTTSATGTVVGDPTAGTTCADGSNLQFRVSSSTFATQKYPIYGYTPLPFYTNVDPLDASSTISGTTNAYIFGVETSSTYAMKVWNAGGDASVLPFPTSTPDYTFTSSTLSFDWGGSAPGFPGIGTYDWFIQATKIVTLGTGWYEFDAGSDDGILVSLDGTPVISSYFLQSLPSIFNKKRLFVTAGVHTIDVKFYEHNGVASLYSTFYPIDPPHAPIVDIGAPVATSTNDRLPPVFGLHTDTPGTLTLSGGCSTTVPITIGVGTSTITMALLPDGTYSSCRVTVVDPETEYATEVAIPTFTVAPPTPIHLSSCAELMGIRFLSTGYAEDYILDSDIDCSLESIRSITWGGGHSYIGTFDGNGHSISHYTTSRPETYNGLFSRISGGTVKNLTLSSGSISRGFGIGSIAGNGINMTLTNVTSSFAITGDPGFFGAGGLVGRAVFNNGSTTTWSNVVFNGTLVGTEDLGGLVGVLAIQSGSSLVVNNARAFTAISPDFLGPSVNRAGGLIGDAYISGTGTLSITNSHVSSTIDVGDTGTDGGGLIGYLNPDTGNPVSVSITHSSSTGSVTGGSSLGGFIGTLASIDGGSTHTIDISHNQSFMTVSGQGANIGGFVGSVSNQFGGAVHSLITFDTDSASGDVTGNGNVGGFLGGSADSGAGTYIQHANGTGGLTISNSTASGAVTGNTLGDNALNAGGFVGYLSCRSNNATQFAACTLRQNSASGNTQGYGSVGGFMGQLNGDIDIEDSYSNGNVTGSRDTGGFLGSINSEFSYANVSHVYASSTVTTSGDAPLSMGGLIGSARSSNANTAIDHAFTIASLVDPSRVARFGWIIGDLTNITPTDLAYSPVSGSAPACIQNNEAASFCSAHTDPSYFYVSSNAPLSDWNFSHVWEEQVGTYPTLRSSAIVIDSEAPGISSLTADPSVTDVQIRWITDEAASANVAYSLDTTYSSYAGVSDLSPRRTNHTVTLTNLSGCQTYHFQVVSSDRYGNTSTSTARTFTTTGCGGGSVSSGSSGGSSGGGWSNWVIVQPIQARITLSTSTPSAISTPVGTLATTAPIVQGSSQAERQCFAYTFTKNLSLRSNTADVKQLQIFLNKHDAPILSGTSTLVGQETTFFGPSTKRALQAFQRAHQLPATGVFASTTRSLIQNMSERITCPPPAPRFSRTLQLRMSGVDVKLLQRTLKVSESGFFGIQTQQALKVFQKNQKLPATGVLDSATRSLLNASSNK